MKIKILLFVIVIILVFIFGIVFFLPMEFKYKNEIEVGNQIIEKIELYKESTGEYSQNLAIITETQNLKKKDIFFYELQENKYVLWFGTTLGEGIYFYSDSKKWEDYIR